MKDTQISPLESDLNRHKQADSMWIGIPEEVKNKRSKQQNQIQPSFKAHKQKHSHMDHKYSRIENLEYPYILNKTPIYKEIDKQHIKKDMTRQ